MVTNPASVSELADDWLTAKRALESAAQAEKGHSDRARRADLERWAPVLGEARGRSPADDRPPIASLVLGDLSEEVLLAAMAAAKRRWSDATVARMLSTLRGFTRWLYRTGQLSADVLDGDLFRPPPRFERRPKSPDAEDIARMLSAAKENPSSRQRMFWPTRDAALLRFLTTGAPAEEACGVTIGELDRRAESPIWRVGRSQGGKAKVRRCAGDPGAVGGTSLHHPLRRRGASHRALRDPSGPGRGPGGPGRLERPPCSVGPVPPAHRRRVPSRRRRPPCARLRAVRDTERGVEAEPATGTLWRLPALDVLLTPGGKRS